MYIEDVVPRESRLLTAVNEGTDLTNLLRINNSAKLSLPLAVTMAWNEESQCPTSSPYPWILEHLLTYPGASELPLRTMYTLNANTTNHQCSSQPTSPILPNQSNQSLRKKASDEQQNVSASAAQLRADVMAQISQMPAQPASLPPQFITNFVRRCFPPELDRVDFSQALTAMDYLKDLEVRRRREVVAALDKLGIERDDIAHKDKLARKYPGVLKWVVGIEEKERAVEALYTQIYIGLRRWTLINELSQIPFNKANCLAMLNTLYPPTMCHNQSFVQPTAQLTAAILTGHRNIFFRYVNLVEKNGPGALSVLTDAPRRPGDLSGWISLWDTLDNYLHMANSVIDECLEIIGFSMSPASSFASVEYDEHSRCNADSTMSLGSNRSSSRNSARSQNSRPGTGSSYGQHGRQISTEKELPEKPLPIPLELLEGASPKQGSSAFSQIASKLRRMKSRSSMREDARPSTASPQVVSEEPDQQQPSAAGRERSLRLKRSIKHLRSGSSSRPGSRGDLPATSDVPVFDAEEMRRRRQEWEAQQLLKSRRSDLSLH